MMYERFSYSKQSTFRQCQEKYRHLYVLRDVKRLPYEPGIDVHGHIEKYLRMEATGLPDELGHLMPILDALLVIPGLKIEQTIKLGRDLKPTQTKWDYHIMAIYDVIAQTDPEEALVIDWKSGKVRDYKDQADIFAAVLLAAQPELQKITHRNVFTGHSHIATEHYTRKDYDRLWRSIDESIEQVKLTAEKNDWSANPSPLCGWCPCTKKECVFAKR